MKKNNNSKVIEELIIALDKMNDKDNVFDINSMYGIFLSKNNEFIICKEDRKKICSNEHFNLNEFFTDENIEYSEVGLEGISYPWRSGKFYSRILVTMAYAVPVEELLDKFFVDKVVTEKDIACLYVNVNKYIKKNPNFIKQLFNEENKKVR